MLGGASNVKDVAGDELVTGTATAIKGDVEKALGKTFNTWEAVKYTSQVVNGVNYQIKIKVDDGYVHASAHRAPGENGTVTFKEAAGGKTLEDGF